ncbi:MAG: HAD-IIB family hydrolase, partial [Thermodesulfobacteriota bacterium]
MDEFFIGPMSQIVIFTDLDGTLLDDQTYDFKPALTALKLIRSRKIPLIMVSSKTRAEVELYRRKMAVEDHPFIVENGGAVYFPGSFPLPDEYTFEIVDGYREVIIGTPLAVLSEKIRYLKEQFEFTSFSELPVEEIAKLTGLSPEQAQRAS